MTHQIQRQLVYAILCIFALAMAGCSPPRSVVWSPDGTMAALMMEDGIFFADRSGKIITPLLKSFGADALSVSGATTFRFVDGHTAICATANDQTISIHKFNAAAQQFEEIAHFDAPWPIENELFLDGETADGLLAISVLRESPEPRQGNSPLHLKVAIFDLQTKESAWIEGLAAGPAKLEQQVPAVHYFCMDCRGGGLAGLTRVMIDRHPLRLSKPESMGAFVSPMLPLVIDARDENVFFVSIEMQVPFIEKREESDLPRAYLYQYDTVHRVLHKLAPKDGDPLAAMSVALSPDGRKLAYINADGSITVQKITGESLAHFRGKAVPSSLFILGPQWVDDQTLCIAVEPSQPNLVFDLALAKVDDPAAEPKVWTQDWKDDFCVKFLSPKPKQGSVAVQNPALR